MQRVLIVDPNKTVAFALSELFKKEFDLDVVTSSSLKETTKIIDDNKKFCASVVDPTLFDDLNGDVVDLLTNNNIPVIVYSSDLKYDQLDAIINKPIVDHLIKPTRNNPEIIVNLLGSVLRHRNTAVLIVDDSKSTRQMMSLMLSNLNLHILESSNVSDALIIIKEHPEIKLVLTDYSMDNYDGLDLIDEVRKKYTNKEIAIIGHSAYGNPMLSADFLKHGANDFIVKPFHKDEFINRVLLQLDTINYIKDIIDSSEKDFLTSIYNRKYVYEVGRKLFSSAKRGNTVIACAMIDIDHFKKVNDTYGHDIGDKVIIRLAQELSNSFRESDIVGRLGGEEFCVVLTNPDVDNLENIFDHLRKKVEDIVIHGEDEEKNKFSFSFTISIGATSVLGDSFEEMLKFSDMKLYEAKNYGRNMVVL